MATEKKSTGKKWGIGLGIAAVILIIICCIAIAVGVYIWYVYQGKSNINVVRDAAKTALTETEKELATTKDVLDDGKNMGVQTSGIDIESMEKDLDTAKQTINDSNSTAEELNTAKDKLEKIKSDLQSIAKSIIAEAKKMAGGALASLSLAIDECKSVGMNVDDVNKLYNEAKSELASTNSIVAIAKIKSDAEQRTTSLRKSKEDYLAAKKAAEERKKAEEEAKKKTSVTWPTPYDAVAQDLRGMDYEVSYASNPIEGTMVMNETYNDGSYAEVWVGPAFSEYTTLYKLQWNSTYGWQII